MKNGMIVLFVVAFAVSAQAGMTTVNPTPWRGPVFREFNLETGNNSVLNQLYGADNYYRIDDSLDGLWSYFDSDSGTAVFEAKFSSIGKATFGFFTGKDSTVFNPLFTVNGFGFANPGNPISASFTFDQTSDPFRFGTLFGSSRMGNLYSSVSDDNFRDLDHMVTYALLDSNREVCGYALAWEDMRCLGDRDYQDLVIQVNGVIPAHRSPVVVPVPGAMVLGSLGIVLIGWMRRTRTL